MFMTVGILIIIILSIGINTYIYMVHIKDLRANY